VKLSQHLDTDLDDRLICPDGCGLGTLPKHWDPALAPLFERLRFEVNRTLFILSGCRCPVHNSAIGGVPNSLHTRGAALDIARPLDMPFDLFALAASRVVGRGGLGFYPRANFIHIDTGLLVAPSRRWHG